MALTCNILNPLQRDGTSQRQRVLDLLKPSSVKIDDRKLADLLLYARHYASFLRYYSNNNSPGGNWVDFINHDITTLVAVIRDTDYRERKKTFEKQKNIALTTQGADQTKAFEALYLLSFDVMQLMDGWIRHSIPGLALHSALMRLLDSVLQDVFQDILGSAHRAKEVGFSVEIPDMLEFASQWKLSSPEPDSSLIPSGQTDNVKEVIAAVARLAALFDQVYESLVFLVNNADSYLQETLERYPEHQPHMALFLAFLKIFEYAQHDLNSLTAKHLDFYYQTVLGIQHRDEVSDQVHIVFELAKNVADHRHLIKEDIRLKAGKDEQGIVLTYATDSELVVNEAVLSKEHGVKGVFVDLETVDTKEQVLNIYAAPIANSDDGKGAEIPGEEKKWKAFGGTHWPKADIGFAIASPMLLLSEGVRTVTLTFGLAHHPAFSSVTSEKENAEKEILENIEVWASGAKEWIPVDIEKVEITSTARLICTFRLGETLGPVVGYDNSALQDGFSTTHPIFKILLKNKDSSAKFPYKYFQEMEAETVDISLDVEGVRTLILENDTGVLDAAKPFHPFGSVPKKNSSFLIGSHEIFQKGLTSLDLFIEWADLPDTDFHSYYAGYPSPMPISGNSYFTAKAHLLFKGDWKSFSDPILQPPSESANTADLQSSVYQLFTTQENNTNPDDRRKISFDTFVLGADFTSTSFERFSTTLKQGFMRLQLNQSFLHNEYPQALALAAKPDFSTDPITYPATPKSPYTPLIASLSLNYQASVRVELFQHTKSNFENCVAHLFHIGPFGIQEIYPIPDDSKAGDAPIQRKLVPEFLVSDKRDNSQSPQMIQAQGTIYIGLEKLRLPQNLSLLIQVAEGSEDPKFEPPTVVWSYLTTQRWVDFLQTEIIGDGTNGLLTSGIVKFSLPKTMVNEGTLMPKGPHWIKASVKDRVAAVPQFIALHPQAVVASFRDNHNDPAHLAKPFTAETISKMQVREAQIKSVSQPYASFGGRMKETDEIYYVRVSERLRHKERAVTIFDYERLVLEHFPEVYKVKCVNHTSDETEYAPGHIRIVVVPNLRNKNAVNPLEPLLSKNIRNRIQLLLAKKASNFVKIDVVNPEYEKIIVDFDVRFQPGKDKGLYTNQLNQDIIRFLSPWLYDNVADLIFGGQVHRSSILNFVEKLEYVDFLTNFQMDHLRVDGSLKLNVEMAEASSSSAALVSADQHSIRTDVESCEDGDTQRGSSSSSETEPSTSTLPPGVEQYLGNRLSREMHDLKNIQPQCQIEEIAQDRRISFSRIQEAVRMGYDFCGHCFPRGFSKR